MKVWELIPSLWWVLTVNAQGLHESICIRGCSDSDGEQMYSLDGEQLWHADFHQQRGVLTLPPFVDSLVFEEGLYEQALSELHLCRRNLNAFRTAEKQLPLKQDAPDLMVFSREPLELGERNTLICLAFGFYPAPVNFSWTGNGRPVAAGFSVSTPLPNGDITFSQVSQLQFTPQEGDVYSCSVEHPALEETLTRIWEVQDTRPSTWPSVFCGVGLGVGLVGVATGTFFLIKGNECRR